MNIPPHCADLSNLEKDAPNTLEGTLGGYKKGVERTLVWVFTSSFYSTLLLFTLAYHTTCQLVVYFCLTFYTLYSTMCGPSRPSSGGRIAVLFPASSPSSNSYSVLFHNNRENTQATFRADNDDINTLAMLRGCSSIDLRIE